MATCALLALAGGLPSARAEPSFAPSASLRLRLEHEDFRSEERTRSRMRLRARLGGSYRAGKGFALAARLSTGSEDPTSSQQTLGDGFAKVPMRLDEAFASYRYGETVALWAGKAAFPVETRRLLWDRDVRGDGFGQRLVAPLGEKAEIVVGLGQYVLVENSDAQTRDAYLVAGQGGLRVSHADLDVAIYAGYFDFVGVNQGQLTFARGTNTTAATGLLRDDYDIFSSLLEMGRRGHTLGTRAHVEIARNTAAADQGMAFTVGGTAQLSELRALEGALRLDYDYRYVERNAILDALAESSWHRQRTNARGHRLGLAYEWDAWVVSTSFKWMTSIDGPVDQQREWLTDLRWTL